MAQALALTHRRGGLGWQKRVVGEWSSSSGHVPRLRGPRLSQIKWLTLGLEISKVGTLLTQGPPHPAIFSVQLTGSGSPRCWCLNCDSHSDAQRPHART